MINIKIGKIYSQDKTFSRFIISSAIKGIYN